MFGSRKNKDQGGEGGGPEQQRPGEPGERPEGDGDFDAAAQMEDLLKQLDEAQKRAGDAERDRDHFQDRYIRTLADYQNSQRRALQNERDAKSQGVKSVVLNILTVLDHFDLALNVDTSKASAEQVVTGVKVIRDELMRTLTNHGVAIVSPQANDEFDPQRHQAVVQENVESVEPGRIVKTLQPGYVLEERLVRPAMVSVRPTA